MSIPAEQCAGLLRDALSSAPSDSWSDSTAAWFADVAGIINAHDAALGLPFRMLIAQVTNTNSAPSSPLLANMTLNAQSEFIARARMVLTQLQLSTNSYSTRRVVQGEVYDYFEEVRQLVSAAQEDVLFIDPYIDATFVARYLPQIPETVTVRLLTSVGQVRSLRPALNLYGEQHGRTVEVRAFPNQSIHDRHLIVDHRDVYQSGASFKDGGRNAPTSINQIVDVASDLIGAHEVRWNQAQSVSA